MTVAASILLAAVVGGVVFVLIDAWQRRDEEEPAAQRTEPVPTAPVTWDAPAREASPAPSPLWSGWTDRRDSR